MLLQSTSSTALLLKDFVGALPLRAPQRRSCSWVSLGRVDELFNDNPRGNEMNKRQKGLAQFLIPRGNASKLFEVMKEPFYLLT